jgi:hypothetical protein
VRLSRRSARCARVDSSDLILLSFDDARLRAAAHHRAANREGGSRVVKQINRDGSPT